jgi:hypothetical protein
MTLAIVAFIALEVCLIWYLEHHWWAIPALIFVSLSPNTLYECSQRIVDCLVQSDADVAASEPSDSQIDRVPLCVELRVGSNFKTTQPEVLSRTVSLGQGLPD